MIAVAQCHAELETRAHPVVEDGRITAGEILGVPSQNIPAGTFEALIAALVSDTTYANVHTTKFPAGEIRGQVQRGRGNGDKQ